MRRLGLIVVALALAGAVEPSSAHAQTAPGCIDDPPMEIITSPPAGGKDVALDAPIQIRVIGDDEPVFGLFRLRDVAGDAGLPDAGLSDAGSQPVDDIPVPARWQRIGETNRFVVRAEDLFEPETDYVITIGTSTGLHTRRDFTTGTMIDSQPPKFTFGPERVTVFSSSPIPPACGEDGESRRISISFDDATDDGNEGGIEYLLYLTRAAGLDTPQLLARQYRVQAKAMAFILTPDQVKTPVCIVVDAVDGVGKHAPAADIEQYCFDPLQGNFFEPCTVGGGGSAAQGRWFLAYMLAVMLALSVRSRRIRLRDSVGAGTARDAQR